MRSSSVKLQMENNAFVDPDLASGTFVDDELRGTWERAGKGKPRWKPGDVTGDIAMDKRLLYSNWVLNPMSLYVADGCSQSTAAQLLLGWLNMPFKTVPSSEAALPRLDGSGVPGSDPATNDGGLLSYGEICSFAVAVAQNKDRAVAPATGRDDVAAWLKAPTIASFRALLRGVQAEDSSPCINAWGLSMDDAQCLPVLKSLLDADGGDDGDLRAYVTSNFAKAGMEL